ncbi:MAG: BatD family protein [Flavobacteriaceae bacterium]|nr:BatD family protein [Flavobacteriaceae bacterium]
MRNNFHILFLILSPLFAWGQVLIFSETNTKEYETTEAFRLNIGLEITGNLEQESPIKLPDLSKFEILGNAFEEFSYINNSGMQVKQIVHQIILEPKQAGKIKIGSALVQINGKLYKSEPFDISVKEKSKKSLDINALKNIYLTLETENNSSFYPYEPIKVLVKAYSKTPHLFRKLHQINFSKQQNSYFKLSHRDEVEEYDDFWTSQIISSFLVFPENIGNFEIPSVLVKFENEKIHSNSLRINIKPFPQNAPKSFDNAVGNFALEIIIPSTHIEKDQGFDVIVKLSGEGNLSHINLPKIIKSIDYKFFKPTRKTNFIATDYGLKGEITEHYVLIPQKEGDININLEEFSFFNPKDKQYHLINKTHAINITAKENPLIRTEEVGHLLKKTELLPISPKQEKSKIQQYVILLILFILIALLGIFLMVFRKKKQKITATQNLQENGGITNISETEEMIKNTLFIGKDYYFRMLKSAIERKDKNLFFEHYEEFHNEIEKRVHLIENQNFKEYLLSLGNGLWEEYEDLNKKIQIEKYAPVSQNLQEIYQKTEKFYSKIME